MWRANESIQSVSIRLARITSNQTDTVMVSIITDSTQRNAHTHTHSTYRRYLSRRASDHRTYNLYLTFNHLNRFLGFPCALVSLCRHRRGTAFNRSRTPAQAFVWNRCACICGAKHVVSSHRGPKCRLKSIMICC